MRLIKKLVISLISIIALIAVLVIGGYIFVRTTYNIDLFNTVKQLKTLQQKVDESALCPNAFNTDDMASAKVSINSSVSNMITYSDEVGYQINLSGIASPMTSEIRLTDKQVGALANLIVQQELGGKITVNDKDLPLSVMQVTFSDIDNGNVTFNTTVKIDITPLKKDMTSFPYNYVSGYIPSYLYVSSTVDVKKESTPFTYTVSHNNIRLNNLTSADTDDLFHTLDTVMKIGSAKDLNESIGNTVINTLIGNENNSGIAYALRSTGATDYNFIQETEINYFVIEM